MITVVDKRNDIIYAKLFSWPGIGTLFEHIDTKDVLISLIGDKVGYVKCFSVLDNCIKYIKPDEHIRTNIFLNCKIINIDDNELSIEDVPIDKIVALCCYNLHPQPIIKIGEKIDVGEEMCDNAIPGVLFGYEIIKFNSLASDIIYDAPHILENCKFFNCDVEITIHNKVS